MSGPPFVSILIPCHNAEQWIGGAIRSALDQTWPHREIIVADDGSTDGSLGVIRSFGDAIRVEVLPHQGGNATRNHLLQVARGSWLQYLDADDYLLPEKVADQAARLADDPETDVLYSPITYEHHEGESTRRELQEFPDPPHDPWVLLARWQLPQTGAPLWRRQAILDVGSWKPDQPCCQEHELYFRLLRAGRRFCYFPKSGAIYRKWGERTVSTRDGQGTRAVRLGILDEVENWLETQGELTPARLDALSLTRFESARMMWLTDPTAACDLDAAIRRKDPAFRPSGPAAPPSYRLAYRFLGFEGAERLAALKRRARP